MQNKDDKLYENMCVLQHTPAHEYFYNTFYTATQEIKKINSRYKNS